MWHSLFQWKYSVIAGNIVSEFWYVLQLCLLRSRYGCQLTEYGRAIKSTSPRRSTTSNAQSPPTLTRVYRGIYCPFPVSAGQDPQPLGGKPARSCCRRPTVNAFAFIPGKSVRSNILLSSTFARQGLPLWTCLAMDGRPSNPRAVAGYGCKSGVLHTRTVFSLSHRGLALRCMEILS